MEQLLIEEANLVEATKTGKDYYIEGVFSTIGERNRNGRIYPKHLWESNVDSYQKHIKENSIYTLGEFQHPARAKPDPMKAVMKIEELFIEDKYVKGKAKILNNNSTETNQIKALIDEGIPISVSSRGVGRLGKGNIVEQFELKTYDIVTEPSDYNANLTGIRESLEKEVYTTETGDIVCKDGMCNLKESENNCEDKAQKLIEALEDFANKDKIIAEKQQWQDIENKFNDIFNEAKIDKGRNLELLEIKMSSVINDLYDIENQLKQNELGHLLKQVKKVIAEFNKLGDSLTKSVTMEEK